MKTRRFLLALALGAACTPALTPRAAAQQAAFPSKMIKVIVPFAAGGGVDVFARLLAEKLRAAKGWSVIVENRPGASGTIGGNAVRTAEADGYTLLFSAGTQVMAQHVLKSAPYDPIADFTPIARVGEAPMMLVLANNRPQNSVAEIVADAKDNARNWTFATAALGAPGHIATIQFNTLANADIPIVTYPGTGPALNDVAGGHVQMLIDPLLALLPQVRGGKVKGIAVTTAKRSTLAPDIPTMAEAGLAGMDQSSWYGLWGAKGMSADLVAMLNQVVNVAVRDLDREGKLAPLGIVPVAETAQAFQDFAVSYRDKSAALLKRGGFEPK